MFGLVNGAKKHTRNVESREERVEKRERWREQTHSEKEWGKKRRK